MIIPGLPILISREDKIKRLVRTFLREETTMRACSLRNLQIIIGIWASLVSRSAWDRDTAGSNPAIPTIWCYSVMVNTSDFRSEKFGFKSQQYHQRIINAFPLPCPYDSWRLLRQLRISSLINIGRRQSWRAAAGCNPVSFGLVRSNRTLLTNNLYLQFKKKNACQQGNLYCYLHKANIIKY